MSKKLTPKALGRLLYVSFNQDDWGDVDIYFFNNPKKTDINAGPDEMCGLYEVLERVCDQINKKYIKD